MSTGDNDSNHRAVPSPQPPDAGASERKPLGERLVAEGLINAEQLEAALQYQKKNKGMFGDALTALGFLTLPQLTDFLTHGQKSLSGEQMVRSGLINQEQLVSALSYQAQKGGRLGNFVTALGFASESAVNAFFAKKGTNPRPLRMGEMLVDKGLLTQDQLDNAVRFQQASGGKLGEVLLSLRYVTPEQLENILAAQMQIGRIGSKLDFTDSKKLPYAVALKYNAIIVNTREDAYILAVRTLLTDNELAEVQSYFDKPLEQVMASMLEIENCWETVYQTEESDESIYRLLNEQPQNSARETLSRGQQILGLIIIVTLVTFLIFNHVTTLLYLNIVAQIAYAALSAFKVWILSRGHREKNHIRFTDEEVAAIDERDLPVVSLLIPVYKEAGLAQLIADRLSDIDYPPQKLDIRILLEEDDPETLAAFKAIDLSPSFTLLVVPDTQPRTKPKACNYGLIRARGEYVVIYDAEDIPERDQLKKVFLAFKQLPDNYACIQAKLNYYNSTQNILTRWFTHEYSTWFDVLLVGVMTFRFPLPLGGTSNFFKTNILREIGAWDPFNVTEDADLGIRLHKMDCRTAVLDSYTFEEANSKLKNWIRQRSRWIKGYLQTWLVHMRHPLAFAKSVGFSGFVGFQAMILGTPLIPLMNPFFWAMTIIWYMFEPPVIQSLFPGILYYFASIQLLLGNFIFLYSNLVGTYAVVRDGELKGRMHIGYNIILAGVLMPIYWMLMSVAAYVALWQLIVKPHYWEKTDHGLTTQTTHEVVTVEGTNDEIANVYVERL